ncbi:MAG: ABC transporter permease [Candidatus Eremiobacteraeota bacterium]|nr:ABC transporter permease [Candidatus Eremiobacteraeota bacterium]
MTLFRALVLRYIATHAWRSLLTALAVTIGVAVTFAIDVANATAIASFASSVNVVANHVNLQVIGLGRGFDERVLLKVQRLAQDAQPVVEGEFTLGDRNGEILHVLGMDVTRLDVTPQAARQRIDLNRFINGAGVILSERVAREHHLHVGDALRGFAGVRNVMLHLTAVVPSSRSADSSVAFVDIATAQEMFDRVGLLDRIDCIVEPAQLRVVASRLHGLLPPGVRVLEPHTRLSEMSTLLQSFQLNLTALGFVALVVAMYLTYNAVAIAVVQRRSEIGTLRALGASRRAIFAAFLAEGALYGCVGAIAGLIVGALLARYSVIAVTQTVSALFVGSHADAPVFTFASACKAALAGLTLALVSSVIPALDAASTPPARAMRSHAGNEPAPGISRAAALGCALVLAAALASRTRAVHGLPVFGYVGAVLLIAGASFLAPAALAGVSRLVRRIAQNAGAPMRLGIAGLHASRSRFAVATASLMVAIAMTVAIATLVDSFRSTVSAWANDTLSADLYVGMPGAVDASSQGYFGSNAVAKLRALPEVADVTTYRGFSLPFEGRTVQLGSTDFSQLVRRPHLRYIGNVDLHTLASTMRSKTGAVVSDPFVNRFGYRPGDVITIQTPSGPAHLRIAAEYNDYSTSEGTILIDDSALRRLFHDDSIDALSVYLKPGVEPSKARGEIVRALRPMSVGVSTNRELRGYVLEIFDRTFAITSALYTIAIIIAMLGVVTTFVALVLERRVEFALLRYVGLRAAQLREVILIQAAVIGALAGALGIVVGLGLGLILVFVINRQSFGWLIDLQIPWRTLFEGFILVIVAALVASLIPAGIATRIRAAEALRSE